MPRRSVRTVLIGAAAAAALLAPTAPATAAPPPAATAVAVPVAAVPQPSAAGADLCSYPAPLGGLFYCGTDLDPYWPYPNGLRQWFVIGTDHAVWTRWELGTGGLSNWTSMGGQAIDGIWAVQPGTGYAPIIQVVGTNGRYYYNDRNPTTTKWSGWHL